MYKFVSFITQLNLIGFLDACDQLELLELSGDNSCIYINENPNCASVVAVVGKCSGWYSKRWERINHLRTEVSRYWFCTTQLVEVLLKESACLKAVFMTDGKKNV